MKKIVAYLPAFTVGAIILGCINVFANYIVYGIDVLPYLEPTEIMLSFASITFELLTVFIGLIVSVSINIFLDEDKDKKKAVEFRPRKSMSLGLKLFCIIVIFIWVFLGWVVGYVVDRADFVTTSLIFVYIVFGPVFIVYNFVIVKYKPAYKQRNIILTTLVICLTVIHLFVASAARERFFRTHIPEYFYVLTLTNNTEFRTSLDLRHIGNSNNYYFFKNVKSEEIVIIPTAEIKEIRRFKIRRNPT